MHALLLILVVWLAGFLAFAAAIPATVRDAQQPVDAITQAVLDCCVTLGYDARSTEGNARESLRWLGENNFTTIRLVTANYHMNRSLLEFRRVMPQITIIANPVFPRQVQDPYWFAQPGTVILLFNEYHKYLVAAARVKISDLGNSIAGFSNRIAAMVGL